MDQVGDPWLSEPIHMRITNPLPGNHPGFQAGVQMLHHVGARRTASVLQCINPLRFLGKCHQQLQPS